MQQQQRIYIVQGDVSDNISSASGSWTDPSKPEDKQEDKNERASKKNKIKNQQGRQYQVTQQPIPSNNLDYYNKTLSTNTAIKKKKKRSRRCCRAVKQSDSKPSNNGDIWRCSGFGGD